MKINKPNFFLVGPPKTGSTALYEFLDKHPDIYMSYPKEIGYFCTDFHRRSDYFHGYKKNFSFRDEKDYLDLFKGINNKKIIGDASTNYFHSIEAPKNIYNFNPNSKILITIREPIDYIISLYSQLYGAGVESESDINKAIEIENERKNNYNILPKGINMPYEIFYSSMPYFSEYINNWINTFGRDNVKVVVFEEFKNDNKKIYKEILDFLDVDNSFVPEFKKINERHTHKSFLIKNIVESPYFFKPLKSLFPKKAYLKLKKLFHKFNRVSMEKPKINKNLKNELMKKYKPEIENLSKLLDKDLIILYGYEKN